MSYRDYPARPRGRGHPDRGGSTGYPRRDRYTEERKDRNDRLPPPKHREYDKDYRSPRPPPRERLDDTQDEGKEGASQESLAMVGGFLMIFIFIWIWLAFYYRPREFILVQLSIVTVVLAMVIIFLHLSHDLKFMPEKTPVNGTNFVAGILTMIEAIIIIEIFKNYSTGKYDMLDGISVIIATLIATTAIYLILHSLLYEKKEPGVHDKVPIGFLSGFAYAGMGAVFYFFFLTEPHDRPEMVFYIGIIMCVLGGLAVFFNLLDDTHFAPRWAR